METEIPIFKPRYPLRTRMVILGLPLLFFALMCSAAIAIARLPFLFWLLAFIIGFGTSLAPFFIIREIRFVDEMVVRRHFLPDQFFSHKELEQVEVDSILAGGQRIRMGEIVNFDELKDMSQRWKAARILKEAQHPQPKKESLYFQRGYGMYASFWGLMFAIIVMLMQPAWLHVDPRWVLGGAFLVFYYLYFYVIPRYF